ncbi:MAG: CoA transferase [Gammaproteobacteria bacterium]|nr:CoA transferase [Gammaproteobacteria bacterium]
MPTRYRVGAAGSAAIMANGLLAAEIWRRRTGQNQTLRLNLIAAAAALRASSYLRVDGTKGPDPWSPISGFYQTRDQRWLQLHCNFPRHKSGVLTLLGCADNAEAVSAAIRTRDGSALEDDLTRAGMCASLVRNRAEWLQHDQGRAVAELPVFEVEKIARSDRIPLPTCGDRPLSGIHVADFTRVLAGPIAGRTLAEHGAQVMRVHAEHLPTIPAAVMDTGHGKDSCHLNLETPSGRRQLHELLSTTDVFLQSYRPGSLANRGLSPERLGQQYPGIIYLSLSAYGHRGPWREKRGFDSLVQSVNGMVHEQSGGAVPRHLPVQALDYISGYLLSLGAMAALIRRAQEGGSYLVRVSLAQTGHWVDQLGRTPVAEADIRFSDISPWFLKRKTPHGEMSYLGPVLGMSQTKPRWDRPSVPLGTHRAQWRNV